MASEAAPTPGEDVMASVDEEGRGGARFVIADITRDEAWVSIPTETATPLAAMR